MDVNTNVHTVLTMLATNHVIAGAAIGAAVGKPFTAFTIGVISHVAMDLIPHWGVRRDGGRPHRFEPSFLFVAVVDGITLLALGSFLVFNAPTDLRLAIAAGAFGALLLDLDKPFELFFGKLVNHRPLWGQRWLDLNIRFQPEHHNRWWVELLGAISLLFFYFNLMN